MTLQTPVKPTETVAQPSPEAAATWAEHKSSRRSGTSGIEKALAYGLLVLGSLVFLIPFYFVVNGSLKSDAQVQAGEFIIPAFVKPPAPGTETTVDRVPEKVRNALPRELGTSSIIGLYEVLRGDAYVYVVRALVKDDEARELRLAADGSVLSNVPFEEGARWNNYLRALAPDKMNFWPALANTVVITTLCVIGQVLSCSLVGYGFARFNFRGRKILFMVMLSTMMLPAQVTLIPVFILFRFLGMIDTFWPLIIPMWLASPFYVFMFRQFFTQIPEELMEAARIDGANNWTIYWRLMMPLCGPVIAIVAIYTFLGAWNAFLEPLIYLNSPENRTLALALNSFKGQYGQTDTQLLMAASVVCMAPCVILFFAMQKYFVESIAMSGLKS